MTNDELTLLGENNITLNRQLFSLIAQLDRNGIMKILTDDEKYMKFTRTLAELRGTVVFAMKNKQNPFDDGEIPF